MKALKNNLGALITIFVLIGLFFVYQNFFKSYTDVSTSVSINQNVGQDLVELYNSIRTVTLDQSLFSSAAYRALLDFSTDLQLQSTGRRNPFDVIGSQ